MTYPTSGSLLDKGINSGLSTQITIKVGPTTVGAIQSATLSQNREIVVHEEIGTDGVVDSHPKNATKVELQVERIVFDQLRLTEAFARGFINLQAQRIPFDIQIIDRSAQFIPEDNAFSTAQTQNLLDQMNVVHTLHNCWFSSYSPTWAANNFIISERATIRAERISTHRDGKSAASGGLRGITYDHDDIERTTDITARVGRFSTVLNNPYGVFELFTGSSS